MRSSRLISIAVLALGVAIVAGACSSAAATLSYPGAGAPQTPAGAGVTIGSTNDPSLGGFLTGQNGMTLYVLTKDGADTSTCNGSCATNWPPLSAAAGATVTGPTGATATFATITRSDGIVQVTYNHMPLYYYAGDSKAGDTAGQGKNGTWFVAPLSGSLTKAPASTSTTSGY
jgi:predicted lipoprotein with Yx(FWY)xxD motif